MRARNCLILGSGRSGTSMLAGALSRASYYMGEHLVPADEANPKGYFEDDEVNAINEALLAPVTPARARPAYGWRWLAAVPVGTPITTSPALAARIAAQTARSPYCFKDPRFCYTLPAWRPFLADPVFLCVFREPGRTAHSIVKEYQSADYLQGLPMDFATAVAVWALMYRHILEVHRQAGECLFLHYDQLFDGATLSRVEAVLGAPLDRQFPDRKLKRSPAGGPVESEVLPVYEQLCALARYRP
jgi:hypothetical protein